MNENVEAPAVAVPSLRWMKVLMGVAVVLSLAWLFYYFRELHWQVRPWLEARLVFLPDSVVRFLTGLSVYVVVPLPMFVFFVAAVRIGLRLDVRRLASPGAMLDAYRQGNRQAAARGREIIDQVLKDATDLSPAEAAEVRAKMEEGLRQAEEDAARREKLYAGNPALLENELRMAMESARKTQS